MNKYVAFLRAINVVHATVKMSELREVFVVSRRKKNGFFGFPNLLVEKELGVSATTRNWATVSKIAQWMRMEADGAISARRSLAG